MADPTESDPWQELRRFTQARIALGRAGSSLPTRASLQFSLAHALARDAVHARLDSERIVMQLGEMGLESVGVHSASGDRQSYLHRPDLGRRLDARSRECLGAHRSTSAMNVVFVIADGLSAIAAQRHAVPVLKEARASLPGWRVGPVIVAEQARVALGDEIGTLLNAEQVVMLIGERPGLSAPDSLGIYLTFAPRAGRTDADRNCISNVHAQGLTHAAAGRRLVHLMSAARQLKLSGLSLKDQSDALASLTPGAVPGAVQAALSTPKPL